MSNIFLIGFMGTGKSTVASYIATHYGRDIIEMDELIAEREKMSIPDIFDKYGEDYFRKAETTLLKEIENEHNKVVSCGGGIVLREQNVTMMKESGRVVLLTAKPETILERVKKDDNRPLLKNNKNVDFIRNMMEQRQLKYEKAADIIVPTDGKSTADICKEIMDR